MRVQMSTVVSAFWVHICGHGVRLGLGMKHIVRDSD